METNEYIIRFREYISNLVNDRETYLGQWPRGTCDGHPGAGAAAP